MGTAEHKEKAGRGPVTVGLVTVSDTRTPETDVNRAYLQDVLQTQGHHVAAYRLIKDEPDQVLEALTTLCDQEAIQMVLFNGGTGIAPRDTTYDVISRHLEKTLPGFGELFRMISFQEIGPAAMLSRATAGVFRQTFVVCMPGSPHAVKTAMEKLILPEINHLAWEVTRKS